MHEETILVLTVGGSPKPLITSIRSIRPQRVVFICSGGKSGSESQIIGAGKPCKIKKGERIIDEFSNLPTYLNLGDAFQRELDLVIVDDPDDPAGCYRIITNTLEAAVNEAKANDWRVCADYTGGTKSMSLSLAVAAIDMGVDLYLTTAERTNLDRVESHEAPELVSTVYFDVRRRIGFFLPELLKQYDYAAAAMQLNFLSSNYQLSTQDRKNVRHLRSICEAFDAWDKFDHCTAFAILDAQMHNAWISRYGLFLKRIIHSRTLIDHEDFNINDMENHDGDVDEDSVLNPPVAMPVKGIRGHGYEIVEDLLLNAERRHAQHRYDDAVGRLYRALELLVQIRLRQVYDIETGNVDIKKVPESLQAEFETRRADSRDGKVKLGLVQSYDLLAAFSDDPVGRLYEAKSKQLLNILTVRNNSLFAHGFRPIGSDEYREIADFSVSFIEKAIDLVSTANKKEKAPQFPQMIDFIMQ